MHASVLVPPVVLGYIKDVFAKLIVQCVQTNVTTKCVVRLHANADLMYSLQIPSNE